MVLSATPARSAMSATVVLAYPCSANSSSAARRIAVRVPRAVAARTVEVYARFAMTSLWQSGADDPTARPGRSFAGRRELRQLGEGVPETGAAAQAELREQLVEVRA